jgi:eukaryotic-like serine/threonine-protein kinase
VTSPAERKPELEKYDIFEEIGHGGMATVYRAHDRRLGRDVAVKIIHRHLRENREVTARFASEARAVARVKHPNVVEVYDVSDDGEAERYLVVELVPGTTLRKLLAAQGNMPAEVAAALGLQIAAGLEHAHEQGVIHRDVKPENVLIAAASPPSGPRSSERDNSRALVKLTDFGIAKLLDAQGVTSTGQVLGSPAHMSPEQIEGGDVTPRSDVFGLGVLLYECMVGKLPFDGKNPAQVLRRVLDGAFTIPERARPTIGSEWSRILSTALAHDPEQRYANCTEFAEAMRGELLRLGFPDPQRELGDYLGDPEGYQPAYEQRIVTQLAVLGRRARDDRKIALAASAYNRALAFRPDDTELLAQVAGLAQRERLRRNAARIGAITAVSVLLGAGAFGVTRAIRVAKDEPRDSEAAVPVASDFGARMRPDVRRPAKPNAPPKASAASAAAARPPVRPRVAAAPTVIPPPQSGTRQVRVVITGAKGGKLRVDGVERDWFGPALALTVGTHTFEFLPPNTDCCVAPAPRVEDIKPGEGEQVVVGEIAFRDAVLRFEAPVGYRASCGLAGTFSSPGEQRPVRMTTPTMPIGCTVEPPASSGQPPKVIDVTLHPGRTSPISW